MYGKIDPKMELKLRCILGPIFLYMILGEIVTNSNALTFDALLPTFSDCCITYCHFINKGIPSNFAGVNKLVKVKVHFENVLLQQIVTLDRRSVQKFPSWKLSSQVYLRYTWK